MRYVQDWFVIQFVAHSSQVNRFNRVSNEIISHRIVRIKLTKNSDNIVYVPYESVIERGRYAGYEDQKLGTLRVRQCYLKLTWMKNS